MEYKTRSNPLFSACGLNCGLCPRYHTSGSSRCPGCAGEGFSTKHPSCGILSCGQRKEIDYCFLCDEFPCKRYNGADQTDSFITHKNQLRDIEKVREMGLDAYGTELSQKFEILKQLLDQYDDGRKKSFFCTAVNLLTLEEVTAALVQAAEETTQGAPVKEKALVMTRLLEEAASRLGISLRLRKKEKA